MDYKVYVTLGFHINFYHSWRGDTPDEAGFGTDMRVMRGVLDILERANARGLKARGYWDTEVYWTFQEILPKHCPDILERMRLRVAAGLDEIVLGPFNNGANHAATADEFRASVAWALENPWGSGLRQLFPRTTSLYRPQETMLTTGQEDILRECGVDGLLLYYAGVPFDTLGVFLPPLSLEQRYNPFWLRTRPEGARLACLPCIAGADVFEVVSLENLMLDLHAQQRRGRIRSDVLIHLNEDADLETWLPMKVPPALKWFPNLGGLEEFIRLVNKYPWADFTLPSEYLAAHPPGAEFLVRQDLADGGFNGSYSWAEKSASLKTWTLLERSRLASCRADSLARRAGLDLGPALWDGMESAFFQRLIGLSTTHFGMSTPVINEERQARALAILGGAARRAEEAEREAARALKRAARPEADTLYEFELYPTPAARELPPNEGRAAVRLPLVLPAGVEAVRLETEEGGTVKASLTEVEPLPDGRHSAELRFVADPGTEPRRYRVRPAPAAPASVTPERSLKNDWLQVRFSEQTGIESFLFEGREVGGPDFLRPFVSYRTGRRPQAYYAAGYTFEPLPGETWDGLQRLRLTARIPMRTPEGEYTSRIRYTFSLFDELPYLFVDVIADYASTPSRQVIHNMVQKLRRLMDLRWVEVAPCPLTPALDPPAGQPLRVWKHNYLGLTSYYDLDYGRINPRNRELDAFNHQVTAGWVAVSDRRTGLLVGESAEALASMAFCPMRLRERKGRQSVSLNPFGSYYGKQFDYAHMGGNGVGSAFLLAFTGALNPNGPSYNGQRVSFSLLLAPYAGDEPPAQLQQEAGAHFYPPGAILHTTPHFLAAETPARIRQFAAGERRRAELASGGTPPPPSAFLANPSAGAVDLVWEAPRRAPLSGYDVGWRAAGQTEWQQAAIDVLTRWRVDGLTDGQPVQVRVRAACGERRSDWTPPQTCTPGAVEEAGVGASLGRVPPRALIKMVFASLGSVVRAWFHRP
jgi:hypothetical protein